jgi:diguanylate cyclase (GGDEF)-like protein
MERTLNELNLQVLEVERQKRELERKERDLMQANLLLGEANKILVEQASRDSLTNLLNRRKGWDFMDYEEEKSRRTQKPIGVVLLDLDRFKTINDTLGHEVGDRVLKATSQCLAETLRATDILIRWGGEEFLVVMPEADAEGVSLAAEKIRKAIEQRPWEETNGTPVTTSIGATVKTPKDSWDAAVRAADRALYQAKEQGRNQVSFCETT